MPRKIPTPPRRDQPVQGGYSAPHWQCFQGARHLLSILEATCREAEERAAMHRKDEGVWMLAMMDGAIERQALSEAVQVFAAMTVEGIANFYCIQFFGDAAVSKPFERLSVMEKLERALPTTVQDRDKALAKLSPIAERLAGTRNFYVHPKPSETTQDIATSRRGDLESAREAVKDVITFASTLRAADHRNGFFLMPMLIGIPL